MKATLPQARRGQDPAASRLVYDDRGAVMVLGIFMCAVMVGALWYVAGIGDAIVYRERLQEASDAAVLSNAVLHARGMNLIVFINLIMACVLAIRVALKVIQLTLIIAAVVFAGLAFIPGAQAFLTLANLCRAGAQSIQSVINSTREPINNTLKGLHTAQKGIARAVPGASVFGSMQVVDKYKPFIATGFSSADVKQLGDGLPVVDGTTDRLCGMAGKAMGSLIEDLIPFSLGPGKGAFADVMSSIVSKGTGYFCELGGSSNPPDLSDLANQTAKDNCGNEYEGKKKKLEEESQKWHAACETAKVVCIDEAVDPNNPGGDTKSKMTGLEELQKSTKPEDKETLARLNQLKDARDLAEDDMKAFDQPKCVENKKKELNKQLKDVPPSQNTNGQGMEPMKVNPKWFNGVKEAQLLSYVHADDGFLSRSPKGVKIGAMKDRRAASPIEVPAGAEFAYAQAEFFYDCKGAWSNCNNGDSPFNDNQEAMWHLAWRARLRRYNKPYDAVDLILNPLIRMRSAGMTFDAARKNLTTDPGNLSRRKELVESQSIESFELH